METTPNDLRQQQFEIKFRGYNPDDVEVFRDLAAAALEEARAEVLKLTEENSHLSERLKHLVAMEETLKAAMIEAQKNAEVTVDNAKREAQVTVSQAKKEADLIVREARTKYEEITGDMHRKMGKLVADINKIRFIKSQYLHQLKNLVSSQLTIVEQTIAEDENEDADFAPPPAPEAQDSGWRTQAHDEPEEELEGFASTPPEEEQTEHVEQADLLSDGDDNMPQAHRQHDENPTSSFDEPIFPSNAPTQEAAPQYNEPAMEQPVEAKKKEGERLSEEWQDLANQLNEDK
ncbi:MAG: DivIVA domain-containing protein [Candidatus Zixiibacteriota bacterium]